jgi:hypothetical protein
MLHHYKRFLETANASIIWESQKAGREVGYCHMESSPTSTNYRHSASR